MTATAPTPQSGPEARLERHRASGRGIFCLLGPEGIGKTFRVRAFVERRGDCTWIDCGAGQPLEAPEAPGMVVLDGADVLDPDGWGRCLALARVSAVVLTCRVLPPVPVDEQLLVQPLSTEEGTRLLALRALQHDAPVSHLDPAALASIVDRLDGLPASLEAAGPYLVVHSARALAAALESGQTEIPQRLRAAWLRTWDALPEAPKAHLAALSVFRGGFDLHAAAAVWEVDDATATDRLLSLRQRGLVRALDTPARFGLPFSLNAVVQGWWSHDERARCWRLHATTTPASRVGWVRTGC